MVWRVKVPNSSLSDYHSKIIKLKAGAPGRKKKKVGQRTLERYQQLLCTHVKPVLGDKQLQQLRAADIDTLYTDIDAAGKIAPRTQHHVHVVLGACLATAHRKRLIISNPMMSIEKVPNPEPHVLDSDEPNEDDIGEGLSESELRTWCLPQRPARVAMSYWRCDGPISTSARKRWG